MRVAPGRLLATTALVVLGSAVGLGGQFVGSGHAFAQERQASAVRTFDIPAQSLASAVSAFGRQSGMQVTLAAMASSELRTNAVRGTYAPAQALRLMLGGTGVSWRITAEGTVVIGSGQAFTPGATLGDGSTLLDRLVVQDASAPGSGFLGTPDWVYETPGAVSVISREAIENMAVRDTRDLLNNVAGAYAGEGQGSFPIVSPNIRGLQDSGRVVVSIDGARQNAQEGGRYGSSGLGNFGMATVDSAFIREVVVDKDTDAGAGYAGSLGGRVDFRTVGADDIIPPGKNWGVELNGTTGTNEFDFQGSVIGAARIGDSISVLGGVSHLRLGEYEPGHHGTVEDTGVINSLTSRDAWASLLKIEGDFGDLQTSLSWMHQENDYAYYIGTPDNSNSFETRNDSVSARLDWDPESPLIALKGQFWFNHAQTDETRAPRPRTPETYIDKELTSFGGVLENTSELETTAGLLTFNYGVEAFRDDGDKSATSETIAENPLYASSYGTFSPPGQRDVVSLFANGKWEPKDWITVSGGLRYDWYRMKGKATYYSRESYEETVGIPCDPVSNHYTAEDYYNQVFAVQNPGFPDWLFYQRIWPNLCMPGTGTTETRYITTYPAHEVDIDRSDGALLPSVTVELKPTDWFRPYVSYSHSFRPPTITEAFIGGGLAPSDNVGTTLAPNTALRPETARTWEIGANMSLDGLFTDSDHLRLKASAFHREIEDYIVMGYIQADAAAGWEYQSFVNAAGITRMRGVELEGNYDAGSFWLGGAVTLLDTKWPTKTDRFNNGSDTMERCLQYNCGTTTSGDIFAISGNVPPRFKFTLDGGVRLMEQRLTLGARVNHSTPTLSLELDDEGNLSELHRSYTTLDLYGSYRFNDNATLRFAVNNVTDVNYVPATSNYLAPGRTFLATMNLKF